RMRFEGRTTGQDGRAGGWLNDEASTGCRLGLTSRRQSTCVLKGERPQDGRTPAVPAYNANGK
ncbi:hypothetical protein ACRCO4_11360, partial [Pseudomonas aeruginosa]